MCPAETLPHEGGVKYAEQKCGSEVEDARRSNEAQNKSPEYTVVDDDLHKASELLERMLNNEITT